MTGQTSLETTIEETAVELLRRAVTTLPTDVMKCMKDIQSESDDEVALLQMNNIVKDASIAEEQSRPMCQDTGIVQFVLKVGDEFPFKSKLKSILISATKKATKAIPLRPNTVDFFLGNPGDNVDPRGHVPYFYIDMIPGKDLLITAVTKGGGSSNIAQLGMLKPGLGIEGALKFAVDVVEEAGPKGCPPYRVGIGIGGGEDICMNLAKKAMLRPIGSRHPDKKVAKLELAVMEACNMLPIGPMGVGAGKTVIDANINLASRHPASLPVGIVISCWALRHASATISPDGTVVHSEYL